VGDSDATVQIEADVPAFLKDIDEMASKTEGRFSQLGKKLTDVFGGVFGGARAGGGNWSQSPMARTTKEWETQVKSAREMVKLERERRDIQRASRIQENRAKYGESAELSETGELKKRRRPEGNGGGSHVFRRAVGLTGTAMGAVHNVVNSGNSNTSVVQAAGTMASALVPALAPVINAITQIGVSAFQKQELFREQALRRYQVGGRTGVDVDEGRMGGDWGPHDFDDVRKRLGFNITDFSSLYSRSQKGGVFDVGGDQRNPMYDLMRLESFYGLGGNAGNMFGAIGKSGGGRQDQKDATALVMGLAVAEGLSRGRMGELFDQLAAAIDDNTEAVTDIEATTNRFAFISQLGAQFRGNTSASREMDQALKGLLTGGKPYTQMTALTAAGFGSKGVGYSEAWLTTQMGLDKSGGVSSDQLITQNFSSSIPAYAAGNKGKKAEIVYVLSQLTGMSGPKVQKILDRLAKGPMGKVQGQSFEDWSSAPNALLRPRQAKAKGEDQWRVGINTEGPGDAMDAYSMENLRATQNAGTQRQLQKGEDFATKAANEGMLQGFTTEQGRFGVKRDNTPAHPGEDLVFPPGTTVRAPRDSTVIAVGPLPNQGDGWYVWLKAADTGYTWQLVHLDPKTIKVGRGQRVKQGDEIGKTLSFSHWKNKIQTHLHVGVMGSNEEGQNYSIDPMTMRDLWKVADESVYVKAGGAPGASAVPTINPSSGGKGGAAGSMSIKVEVHDKTTGGVDVRHETKSNAREAKQPAPGDTPAMTNVGEMNYP
jgi:murein DD-endopeptidase MepM/ murein hydrolase activator NlpD